MQCCPAPRFPGRTEKCFEAFLEDSVSAEPAISEKQTTNHSVIMHNLRMCLPERGLNESI
jgi:hypothetical protein